MGYIYVMSHWESRDLEVANSVFLQYHTLFDAA